MNPKKVIPSNNFYFNTGESTQDDDTEESVLDAAIHNLIVLDPKSFFAKVQSLAEKDLEAARSLIIRQFTLCSQADRSFYTKVILPIFTGKSEQELRRWLRKSLSYSLIYNSTDAIEEGNLQYLLDEDYFEEDAYPIYEAHFDKLGVLTFLLEIVGESSDLSKVQRAMSLILKAINNSYFRSDSFFFLKNQFKNRSSNSQLDHHVKVWALKVLLSYFPPESETIQELLTNLKKSDSCLTKIHCLLLVAKKQLPDPSLLSQALLNQGLELLPDLRSTSAQKIVLYLLFHNHPLPPALQKKIDEELIPSVIDRVETNLLEKAIQTPEKQKLQQLRRKIKNSDSLSEDLLLLALIGKTTTKESTFRKIEETIVSLLSLTRNFVENDEGPSYLMDSLAILNKHLIFELKKGPLSLLQEKPSKETTDLEDLYWVHTRKTRYQTIDHLELDVLKKILHSPSETKKVKQLALQRLYSFVLPGEYTTSLACKKKAWLILEEMKKVPSLKSLSWNPLEV